MGKNYIHLKPFATSQMVDNSSYSQSLFLPILLVNDQLADNNIIRRAGLRVFPEASFVSVAPAANVISYLDNLRQDLPRLVFFDVSLSDNGLGFNLLERFKRHPKGRLMTVIVFSESDNESYVEKAYDLGAASYIVKPSTYSDLEQILISIRSYWYETVSASQIRYFE